MQTNLPLAVLLWGCAIADAGSLERIRQIPISDYAPKTSAMLQGGARVPALSFSPDEEWIAFVIAEKNTAAGSRLVVVRRERQPDNLKFSGRIAPLRKPPYGFPAITWSPEGNLVAVASDPPLAIRFADERSCPLSSGGSDVVLGGFLSESEMVTAQMMGGAPHLLVYGLDCKPKLNRDLAAPVTAIDVNARTRRILVATGNDRVAVYDGVSGKVVKEWGRSAKAEYRFASSGEMVCAAGPPAKSEDPPSCWSIANDTGSQEAALWGGAPFVPAEASQIVAFTDGKYRFDKFFETARETVRGGVIWDFAVGKLVARWRPNVESCSAYEMLQPCEQPAAFAISAKGTYFAEVRGEAATRTTWCNEENQRVRCGDSGKRLRPDPSDAWSTAEGSCPRCYILQNEIGGLPL